jgi:Flp pilus assembly protein TadB
MDSSFYPVFVFFAALILVLFSFHVVGIFSKVMAWREFKRLAILHPSSKATRAYFNSTMIVTLFLGLGVSWICTHKLVFGLVSLGFIPFTFRALMAYQRYRAKGELEKAALPFFNALLGLVKSGQGLSTALLKLCDSQNSIFSERLGKQLQNFESGRGFGESLASFRKKTQLPTVGPYLATLAMAHHQGLEIVPLIERMIPNLETELQFQSKRRELLSQTLAQALIAFVTPWFLAWVLNYFNPELVRNLSGHGWVYGMGFLSLTFEILGLWILWQVSRFF